MASPCMMFTMQIIDIRFGKMSNLEMLLNLGMGNLAKKLYHNHSSSDFLEWQIVFIVWVIVMIKWQIS